MTACEPAHDVFAVFARLDGGVRKFLGDVAGATRLGLPAAHRTRPPSAVAAARAGGGPGGAASRLPRSLSAAVEEERACHPGAVVWFPCNGVNPALLSAVLARFAAAAVGAGPHKRVVPVLDGAGWHATERLTAPPASDWSSCRRIRPNSSRPSTRGR